MSDLTTHSIRAQILQALGYRAEGLLVLLPAGTDIEPRLYWARQSLQPGELPAVVVTPQPESAARSYGADELTVPVTVSLVCLLGSQVALDLAEFLLAELRRRIPASDPTLGGLAQDLRYVEGGVDDYPERDDQALVVNATFEIDYTTIANNPDQGA